MNFPSEALRTCYYWCRSPTGRASTNIAHARHKVHTVPWKSELNPYLISIHTPELPARLSDTHNRDCSPRAHNPHHGKQSTGAFTASVTSLTSQEAPVFDPTESESSQTAQTVYSIELRTSPSPNILSTTRQPTRRISILTREWPQRQSRCRRRDPIGSRQHDRRRQKRKQKRALQESQ